MKDIKSFNDLCHDELVEALENVYPIRDKLQQTLIDTYNEELLDKIIVLNKIIADAEILLSKKADIKKFYAERYPEYVDEDNNINNRGLFRVQLLKKKWKTLGYLRKNS
jgi:hypothetical protein|tara:strand:- start:71916 stop:72242 length:327 start_codon:yes stop_codon:yes gene_type:complete